MKWTILFILTVIACSCGNPQGWQSVQYTASLTCDSLATLNTSIEGMCYPITCNAYIENDTLVVYMPADLTASWQSVTIKIHNGRFKAETDGYPFEPIEYTFKTVSQKLQLGKTHYAENDTLCGSFDMVFQNIDKETKKAIPWNFKGVICEIVRSADFNPFRKENYMSFDFPTAIHELGEPLHEDTFDTEGLPEFSIELLNFFPPSKDIIIKELTWDISDTRGISDEGRERLTVWYAEKNHQWMPVHHRKWHADSQF